MGMENALMQAGFRPKGVDMGAVAGTPFQETIDNIAKKQQEEMQKQEKAAMEKQTKTVDMYKTLRESGYSAEDAYENTMAHVEGFKKPTEPVGSLKKTDRDFTAEQAEKRKIGKQNLIDTIGYWGKNGNLYDPDEKRFKDIKDVETFKQMIISKTDLGGYLDRDDPEVAEALVEAIKAQTGKDLKTEAKKEGKTLGVKIKEFFLQNWL